LLKDNSGYKAGQDNYHKYCFYGLGLLSKEALPGLLPAEPLSADIFIESAYYHEEPDISCFKTVKSFKLNAPATRLKRAELLICEQDFMYKILYIYNNGGTIFSFNQTGNKIKIAYFGNIPFNTLSRDAFNLFYHPVMVYLARLHGRICLHANIILVKDRAVAFIGESGAGKSTLSAFLWAKGFRVLADDLGALTEDSGIFQAWQGQQRLRIRLSTARAVIGSNFSYESVFQETELDDNSKVYLGALPEYLSEKLSYPLAVIYILKPRRKDLVKPVIQTLSAIEALPLLEANTRATEIMGQEDRIKEFRFLAKLAKTVTIKSIELPDSLELLNDSGNIIIDDIYCPDKLLCP
jgi:hypothetical protein